MFIFHISQVDFKSRRRSSIIERGGPHYLFHNNMGREKELAIFGSLASSKIILLVVPGIPRRFIICNDGDFKPPRSDRGFLFAEFFKNLVTFTYLWLIYFFVTLYNMIAFLPSSRFFLRPMWLDES